MNTGPRSHGLRGNAVKARRAANHDQRLALRDAAPSRGTGIASPFLPFSITTAISSSSKRFGRGCKPRPATSLKMTICPRKARKTRKGIKMSHCSMPSFPRAPWECSQGAPRRAANHDQRLALRDAAPSRGTGIASPFLPFSITTAISSSSKRFGRGCKPRPATGNEETEYDYSKS